MSLLVVLVQPLHISNKRQNEIAIQFSRRSKNDEGVFKVNATDLAKGSSPSPCVIVIPGAAGDPVTGFA